MGNSLNPFAPTAQQRRELRNLAEAIGAHIDVRALYKDRRKAVYEIMKALCADAANSIDNTRL